MLALLPSLLKKLEARLTREPDRLQLGLLRGGGEEEGGRGEEEERGEKRREGEERVWEDI